MTIWTFIHDNWIWILLAFMLFGGTIAEICGNVFTGFGHALSGRGKNTKLKAENRYLKRENDTLKGLLERGGAAPNVLTAMTHEAELVDIVSRVQATDDAWSQLPKPLRQDIDGSLARYRHREVS